MDAFALSAISLAAGGWDKVKPVNMLYLYGTQDSSVSPWKLGIAQLQSTQNDIPNTVETYLVFPGAKALNSGMEVTFGSNTISSKPYSVGGQQCATAILFTW